MKEAIWLSNLCTCLQTPFFDILVPTIDTQRYGYIMEKLTDINHSVLFTGTTGVGKVCKCVCVKHFDCVK